MGDSSFAQHAGPAALQRLLDAVLSIGSDLDLSSVLLRIAEAATELVHARYGALGVLDESGTRLSEFITVGIDDAERAKIGDLPEGHGILGLLIVEPKPLRLPDLSEHPDSYGFPPNHPKMTSFLGVPIRVRDRVFGNLYLCDRRDDEVFSDVDEEMAVALAAAAGIAIEQARLHQRFGEVVVFEDRERIARDLHDRVIQRLFATGLTLQSIATARLEPEVARRLEQVIDDLDETVRQVRSTIFELQSTRLPGRSLRQEVLDVCAEAAPALGFEPIVRFEGAIDSLVDGFLTDHVLAVLREALANVARHAQATSAEVDVRGSKEQLEVVVVDNGIGPPDDLAAVTSGMGEGNGLRNMRARAARVGGTVIVERAENGGTRIRWTASPAAR